jgi:aryl-alcohol dehydrogenase-like predicted oxidoreductase
MATIPTRPFGKSGLEVTALGYGAMEVRGPRIWGGRPVADEQAEAVLNAVLDAGVNFIDTANDYGRSEEFIGRFLSHRTDEFYIATKCGCTVVRKDENTDETPHVWTRDNLLRGIDESLARLRRNFVDLLQLHNPSVEQAETGGLVAVLEEIRDSGRARLIGCSSTAPHLDTYIRWGVFDAFQIPYSALERRHEHAIQRAAESGAAVIVRGGVARGEPGAGMGSADRWQKWNDAHLDELLSPGETRTQWLLRFTLNHPGMSTNIVGTLNPDHLAENAQAAAMGPLPQDVYDEARRRLDAAGEKPEA